LIRWAFLQDFLSRTLSPKAPSGDCRHLGLVLLKSATLQLTPDKLSKLLWMHEKSSRTLLVKSQMEARWKGWHDLKPQKCPIEYFQVGFHLPPNLAEISLPGSGSGPCFKRNVCLRAVL
jgi:hypothetical protein